LSASAWIILTAVIAGLLLFDLLVVGRSKNVPSMRRAAVWSAAWTALGLIVAVPLLATEGAQMSGEYVTGFLIEKSLSLDNLFVFAVLLGFFAVPQAAQRRVLVWGIALAIVLRFIFILIGAAALEQFSWTIYAFGALLLFTAFKMARTGDAHIDPNETKIMKFVRKVLPVAEDEHGDDFTVRRDGKRLLTATGLALIMVAAFDVMFAVDSVPAIFAVSQDTFVVFAANAFSLLGMTSLYFLLAGMLDKFRFLSQGLAAILAFVGVKMMLIDVWHAPTWLSLSVIVGVLVLSALASMRWPAPHAEPEPQRA
jgi:tellurite resistance protein TerC